MILFVNVFITDQRMVSLHGLPDIRSGDNKYDIFKYTLASYSVINWSKVYIYYELDARYKSHEEDLTSFIYDLFGQKVVICNNRISELGQWKAAIKLLLDEDDEFIWFTCNDDHVYIDSSTSYLYGLLEKVKVNFKSNKYISILISHWHENICQQERAKFFKSIGSSLYSTREAGDILETNMYYQALNFRNPGAIQILSKYILDYWFCNGERLPTDLRRTDKIDFFPEGMISIIPNRELVRHFDGYTHAGIPLSVVPVMKIPNGFFEKNIKIQYGYDKRIPGYFWINPFMSNYKRRFLFFGHSSYCIDRCDLNISFDEIPAFWHSRISQIIFEEFPQDRVAKIKFQKTLKAMCADKHMGFNPFKAAKVYKNILAIELHNNIKKTEILKIAISTWSALDWFKWIHFRVNALNYSGYKYLRALGFCYYMLWAAKKLFSKEDRAHVLKNEYNLFSIFHSPIKFMKYLSQRKPRY